MSDMPGLYETLPKMSVSAISHAIDRDHYIVAPHDTIETWQMKILVVIPGLDSPTWVVKPRTRTVTRRSVLALAVPSLDAFTVEMAQQLTREVTDYITLYEWPRSTRQKGAFLPRGPQVPAPWLSEGTRQSLSTRQQKNRHTS